MEKEANQLYRRPQMTGQARDEEEEGSVIKTKITQVHLSSIMITRNSFENKKIRLYCEYSAIERNLVIILL